MIGAQPGDDMESKTTQPRIIYVDIDDTLVRSFGSKRIPMADIVALIPFFATMAPASTAGAAAVPPTHARPPRS
jgi:hypothetical protein